MDKITLKLTNKDWLQLTGIVLALSTSSGDIEDKYLRAMRHTLLRQVYIKLHNRMHSLKPNNSLRLTIPEASALVQGLQEESGNGLLVIEVISAIDRKLT